MLLKTMTTIRKLGGLLEKIQINRLYICAYIYMYMYVSEKYGK